MWYVCNVGYDRLQVVPYVEERCFEYVCVGIWQDVVLCIPSGCRDVGGSWNAG